MERERREYGWLMKVCVNQECKDRFCGGSVWDRFCPRCGKPLKDSASDEAQELIKEGWWDAPKRAGKKN